MDSFQSALGDAAGGALCNILTTYGAAATSLGAIALAEPSPAGEVVVATGGLATLAAAVGCDWNPDDPNYPPVPWTPGCQKATGTGGPVFVQNKVFLTTLRASAENDAVEILQTGSNPNGTSFVKYRVSNGDIREGGIAWPIEEANYFIDLSGTGNTCETTPAPPPPLPPPPYTYTDPNSGCEISVTFLGWGVDPAGVVGAAYEMAPANPQGRSGGGIIGGCNFAPIIYYDERGGGGGNGGGGGGPVIAPVPDPLPPDTDEPWWADLLRAAISGATAAAVNKALEEFFAKVYAGGSYQLKGVCELDPDGNPMDVTRSINFPEATSPDAILYRLDALADMFQFAKDLKQPICTPTPTPPTGEPVTITFRSDLPSPVSGDPVRKIFTYFDQSGSSQLDHTLHWENFSWEAGPVVVSVSGTNLGTPQVWAASEAEGQRVINHAAQIAGADMSQVKWLVGSPRSQRYGLSGTMRVYVDKASRIWVTKRDGPDGLPYVYKRT